MQQKLFIIFLCSNTNKLITFTSTIKQQFTLYNSSKINSKKAATKNIFETI